MSEFLNLINMGSTGAFPTGLEGAQTQTGGEAPSFMAYLAAMMNQTNNSTTVPGALEGKNILSSKKMSSPTMDYPVEENNSQSQNPWGAILTRKDNPSKNEQISIDTDKLKAVMTAEEPKTRAELVLALLTTAETMEEKEELLSQIEKSTSFMEAVKADLAKSSREDRDALIELLASRIKSSKDMKSTAENEEDEPAFGTAPASTADDEQESPYAKLIGDIPTAEAYMAQFEEMLRAAKDVLAWIRTEGSLTDNVGYEEEKQIVTLADDSKAIAAVVEGRAAQHAESAVFDNKGDFRPLMPGKDTALSAMAQTETKTENENATTRTRDEDPQHKSFNEGNREKFADLFEKESVKVAKNDEAVKADDKGIREKGEHKEAVKQEPLKADEVKLEKAEKPVNNDAPKAQEVKTQELKAEDKKPEPIRTARSETAQKVENPVKTETSTEKAPAEQTRQAAQVKTAPVAEQSAKYTEQSKAVDAVKQEPVRPASESALADSDTKENKNEDKSENKFASALSTAKNTTEEKASPQPQQKSTPEQSIHQPAERVETKTADVQQQQPQHRATAAEERVLQWQSVRDAANLAKMVQQAQQNGETKLTVRLNPEHLGRLEIQLTEVNGRIDARILASSQESRNLLASAGDIIRQQLLDKGIHIDNMDFNFHDALARQNQNGQDQENQGTNQRNQHTKNGKNTDSSEVPLKEEKTTPRDGLYA